MLMRGKVISSFYQWLPLVIFDLIAMASALYMAVLFRLLTVPNTGYILDLYIAFLPVFLLWLAFFYAHNLYSSDISVFTLSFVRQLSQSLILDLISGVFFFYISRGAQYAPKTILLYTVLILGFLQACFRLPLIRIVTGKRKRNVVVLAAGPDVSSLKDSLRARKHGVYQLKAAYPPDEGGLNDLFELLKKDKIDDIVLSGSLSTEGLVSEQLFDLLRTPVDIHSFSYFYETNLQKLPLADITQFWILEGLGNNQGRRYDSVKRLIDTVMALSLLVLTSPLLLCIALLIKLDSPGPLLFRQRRCGRYNSTYTIIKFRTMRVFGNDGSPTAINDTRVTRCGKFLRKTRLDELPQLWNVMRGEMSLIGPRPERPEIAEMLEKVVPFYRQRLLVRPGISGWDQVSGEYHSPSAEDTYKKLQSDLYYIKNRSIFLDLKILLKTISTVISKSGV